MTIAVLLKQVPDTTAKITVSNGRVDENAVSKWSFSPYDEYALEAALQLKESMGGELVAITAGPARCEKLLRDAAAVGLPERRHLGGHAGWVNPIKDQSQQLSPRHGIGD